MLSGESSDPREALIVALDQPDLAAALGLVERLRGQVRWFKVGLELFTACGPTAVAAVREAGGRVFLDLKLHDIPETVARATRAAARSGAELLSVHAAGGGEMLRRAVAAAAGTGLRLLGITVLTSLEAADLTEDGVTGSVEEVVLRRARLARACGVDGVVASPLEVAALRRELPGALLVTPGVRLQAGGDDQRRVGSPRAAIRAGADAIVVGRPVRDAADPTAAAAAMLREIAAGVGHE